MCGEGGGWLGPAAESDRENRDGATPLRVRMRRVRRFCVCVPFAKSGRRLAEGLPRSPASDRESRENRDSRAMAAMRGSSCGRRRAAEACALPLTATAAASGCRGGRPVPPTPAASC